LKGEGKLPERRLPSGKRWAGETRSMRGFESLNPRAAMRKKKRLSTGKVLQRWSAKVSAGNTGGLGSVGVGARTLQEKKGNEGPTSKKNGHGQLDQHTNLGGRIERKMCWAGRWRRN